MKVKIYKIECKRCGHRWIPRKTDIRMCPKCKSPYWDRDRIIDIKKSKAGDG